MSHKTKKHLNAVVMAGIGLSVLFVSAGCGSMGRSISDLSLAGVGGVAGYQLSDGHLGGAAAGAALGYVGSQIAQIHMSENEAAAERRGYERARAQQIKERYWAQQREQARVPAESDTTFVPIQIREASVNGVVTRSHVEYLRAQK